MENKQLRITGIVDAVEIRTRKKDGTPIISSFSKKALEIQDYYIILADGSTMKVSNFTDVGIPPLYTKGQNFDENCKVRHSEYNGESFTNYSIVKESAYKVQTTAFFAEVAEKLQMDKAKYPALFLVASVNTPQAPVQQTHASQAPVVPPPPTAPNTLTADDIPF